MSYLRTLLTRRIAGRAPTRRFVVGVLAGTAVLAVGGAPASAFLKTFRIPNLNRLGRGRKAPGQRASVVRLRREGAGLTKVTINRGTNFGLKRGSRVFFLSGKSGRYLTRLGGRIAFTCGWVDERFCSGNVRLSWSDANANPQVAFEGRQRIFYFKPFPGIAARTFSVRMGGKYQKIQAGWEIEVTARNRDQRGTLYKVKRAWRSGWTQAKNVWHLLSKRPYRGVTRRWGTLWSINWKRLKKLPRGARVDVLRKVRDGKRTLLQIRHQGVTGWMSASYVKFTGWIPRPATSSTSVASVLSASGEASSLRGFVGGIGVASNPFSRATIGDYVDLVKDGVKQGLNWFATRPLWVLKQLFVKIFNKVKAGCHRVVSGILSPRWNPITWIWSNLSSQGTACLQDLTEELLCGALGAVSDVASAAWGAAKNALSHKACWAAGVVAPAVGAFVCGYAYWVAPKLKSAVSCLMSDGILGVASVLWNVLRAKVCKKMGEVAREAVLTALGNASGLAHTILSWIEMVKENVHVLERAGKSAEQIDGVAHQCGVYAP